MKVAFDLDGVVYNLLDPLDEYMRQQGFPLLDVSNYAMSKRYGLGEKEGMDKLDEFGLTRPFLTMPLYEKGREEMMKFKDHELYIITYRDWTPNGIEDTLTRIEADGLPVNRDNVIFSSEKGKWARCLGIDLFYEDSVDNVIDIEIQSDAQVILIDAPYNQYLNERVIRKKWGENNGS